MTTLPYIFRFIVLILITDSSMSYAMHKAQFKQLISCINCESPNLLCDSLLEISQKNFSKEDISLALLHALKKQEKSIFMHDKYKTTSLHFACASGHGEVSHIILLAAKKLHNETLHKLLLWQRVNGSTPLHWASFPGNEKCIKENLDFAKGCDDDGATLKQLLLTVAPCCGYTPLHWTCNGGYLGCTQLLLREASALNDDLETFKKLLTAQSNQGNTALNIVYLHLAKLRQKDKGDDTAVLLEETQQCVSYVRAAYEKAEIIVFPTYL